MEQTFFELTLGQQCIKEVIFGRTDDRSASLKLDDCHDTIVFFDLTTFQTLLTI
jgi:hypothetical protein